ncbi:MAG TPA: VOC family protein, partial [Solirubrobacterales bacterium]|nr:VOC family protein [Solirubrobacterales bacterium]
MGKKGIAAGIASLMLLMAAPGRADSDAACGTVGAVRVRAMCEIGLTVADLEREVAFFTEVLAFEVVGRGGTARGAVDAWLGLDETELRTAELQLGDERIRLTEHRGRRGRPWPADSRSCDHWFQHLAIVVRDLDKAYAALRRQGVRHISTGPQTLPAWNREAGGIRAFYFRDPEDHPLELIWFP